MNALALFVPKEMRKFVTLKLSTEAVQSTSKGKDVLNRVSMLNGALARQFSRKELRSSPVKLWATVQIWQRTGLQA